MSSKVRSDDHVKVGRNRLSKNKAKPSLSKQCHDDTPIKSKMKDGGASTKQASPNLNRKEAVPNREMSSSCVHNDDQQTVHSNPDQDLMPLDASKDDSEIDDLPGLKFCSQENDLDVSCDGDNQCEVRWDCYSPETVKQLKKMRGQYNAEEVKRIVANFNDAHVKPQQVTTLKFLQLPGPRASTNAKGHSLLGRTRLSSKRPQRSTSRKAVEEMILLLQGKIAEQNKTAVDGQSAEDPNNNNNGRAEETKAEVDGDCWSDEDLFQDNSFLIEATQNPEKFIKDSGRDLPFSVKSNAQGSNGINASSGMKGDNICELVSSQVMHSQSPNSSVIPSSFAPLYPPKSSNFLKQSNVHSKPNPAMGQPSRVIIVNNPAKPPSYNAVKKPSNLSSSKALPITSTKHSTSSYNTKFTSSVTQYANKNFDKTACQNKTLQSSQPQTAQCSQSIRQLPPGAKVKSSFKKFNSFQVEGKAQVAKNHLSTALTHHQTSHQSSNSSLNKSFKRTISFDSSCYVSSHSSPLTDSKPVDAGSSNAVQQNCDKNASSNSDAKVKAAPLDDGFDLSLTEDVLQQLLEAEKVFNSQADILSSGCPVRTTSNTSSATSSISSSLASGGSAKPAQVFAPKGQSTSSGTSSAVSGSTLSVNLPSSSLRPANPYTDCMTSPPASKHGSRLGSLLDRGSTGSLRSSTPVRPLKQRASAAEPVASTPAKLSKATDSALNGNAQDSSSELFDSFLNEDVYESQILPFLEKIESETANNGPITCVPTAAVSASPVKCSPEEIEEKRQAALQRRSLRLSQSRAKTGAR